MKKPVVSLVLAVACAPAWSGEAAAPVIDRLVSCTEVQDTRQRLACFDREIAPLARPKAAAVPAPPRTEPTAAVPVPVAPAPSTRSTPSLGEEQLSSKIRPAAPAEEQALHARITALSRIGSSAYAVSLDNDQTWRHEDQHLGSYLREGDAVTISKGTLGSYRLVRDAGDSKTWIRVTRIR